MNTGDVDMLNAEKLNEFITVKQTNDLNESIAELEKVLKMFGDHPADIISMQSYSPISIIRKLLGAMGNVLRNITYSIIRFNKDMTESEFMLFTKTNRTKVRTVINLPYTSFAGTTIDVPTGLKTSYEKLLSDITLGYNVLSMLETSSNISKLFNSILNDPSDDNIDYILTETVRRSIENRIKNSSKLVKDNFEKSATNRVKFEKVFPSNNSLKNVVGVLGSLEHRILNVSDIYNNMKECEDICDKIISGLSATGDEVIKLSNNSLKVLGKYVRDVASIFDNFSLTLTSHQVTEHNMVYVIKELGTKHNIF